MICSPPPSPIPIPGINVKAPFQGEKSNIIVFFIFCDSYVKKKKKCTKNILDQLDPVAPKESNDDPETWTSHQKNMTTLTRQTCHRMRFRSMVGKLRTSVPSWNLPRELWRVLFVPSKFSRANRWFTPLCQSGTDRPSR